MRGRVVPSRDALRNFVRRCRNGVARHQSTWSWSTSGNDRSCSHVGRRLKGVHEFSVVEEIADSDVVPASGRIGREIAPPCRVSTPVASSSRDIVRRE